MERYRLAAGTFLVAFQCQLDKFLVSTVHDLVLIVVTVPNCCSHSILDVGLNENRCSPERRSILTEGALDLVVHGRVGGSEKKKKEKKIKKRKFEPGYPGFSSRLCCLSSVLLLLGASVLAVFSAAVGCYL